MHSNSCSVKVKEDGLHLAVLRAKHASNPSPPPIAEGCFTIY